MYNNFYVYFAGQFPRLPQVHLPPHEGALLLRGGGDGEKFVIDFLGTRHFSLGPGPSWARNLFYQKTYFLKKCSKSSSKFIYIVFPFGKSFKTPV